MADSLMASAQVPLPDPLATIRALEVHFASHRRRGRGVGAAVRPPHPARGQTFIAACESPDAAALGFLKMVTAEGFIRTAPRGCGTLVWAGDGADTGLPFFRAMEVVASHPRDAPHAPRGAAR